MEKWTEEDHVMYGLNQQALNHIMSMLDSTTYGRVSNYTNSTKDLWNKLIKLSLGTEEIRKNKLNIVMQHFNSFEMISRESIEQMETHFLNITTDLSILQMVIPQREMNTKVLHALPKEWHVMTIQLKRNPNFNNTTT